MSERLPDDYNRAGRLELLTGKTPAEVDRVTHYRRLMAEADPLAPLVLFDPEGAPIHGRSFLEFVAATGDPVAPAVVVHITDFEADLVADAAAAAELTGHTLNVVAISSDAVVAGDALADAPLGPLLVVTLNELTETGTPWGCDIDGEPIEPGREVFMDGPPEPGGSLPRVRCEDHAAMDNGHTTPPETVHVVTDVPHRGDPSGAPVNDSPAIDYEAVLVSAEVGPNAALRVKAAAELLGCSDRRVRDFITEGRLETIPGKPLRVTRASLDALIAERVERGVTPTAEVAEHGPPAGGPSGDLRQVLEAVAMLTAQVSELRAQLEARPAIEAQPTRQRWGIFTRRNRANVPTDDPAQALEVLRQHYSADQLRAALGDPAGDA
jgi:hypothetical protein